MPRSGHETQVSSPRAEADARDQAQFVLGAISLVIWFVLAFTLAVRWFVDEYTAQPLFMAGGVAFAIAALPWLAYRPLTRHFASQHQKRRPNSA